MENLEVRLSSKRDELAAIIMMCQEYVTDQSIPKEDKKWHGALWHSAQIEYDVINSFLEPGAKSATDLYVVDGKNVTFLYADMMEERLNSLKKENPKNAE
jgi:hypothetical protein